MERVDWRAPALRAACVSCLALIPTLEGCASHLTTSVTRTDRYITYVQRSITGTLSDTLVDCRPGPDGVSQLCDVIRLDGAR